MRSSQRPQGRYAAPCQDTLRAFLVEHRMGGMFFHVQLAKHLGRAGFEVRQVKINATRSPIGSSVLTFVR